ncbi:hypothetical protein GTQ34_14130 [Muricauda sp. JGD-17]|uniref:TfoX N-terminal domain-containing protein n=1 Tax=Flagellimonas ochracea TaxID=2696472 RepID=A0A964TDS0_9FLAO|nr:hypothetical protein [Allomuricauda ochracea]NAY93057.1 hypothetical protein [Allomuricauda ochracea]
MKREEVLELYRNVIAKNSNFELKGKSMPYTSANGHMFSQLNKDGELGIRLSKTDTSAFDTKYGAKPFTSYGAVMKEYVLVPEVLFTEPDTLGFYLQKGYEYVMSLPPK